MVSILRQEKNTDHNLHPKVRFFCLTFGVQVICSFSLSIYSYNTQLASCEIEDEDKASTIACLIVKELRIDFHNLLGVHKIFLHYYYQIDFD